MTTVAICSSMSFYQEVIKVAHQLESLGFKAVVPETALIMEKENNYKPEGFLKEHFGDDIVSTKRRLMKSHFDKIAQADIVLVVNLEKHGVSGYIGPNVLMELGMGLHFNKELFVLYPWPNDSSFIEEIEAMAPICLNGNLSSLKNS